MSRDASKALATETLRTEGNHELAIAKLRKGSAAGLAGAITHEAVGILEAELRETEDEQRRKRRDGAG